MPFTIKQSSFSCAALFSLFIATPLFASQLSVSTEVEANLKILVDTKNCPGCNLSGAILNRFELSGANLEGANLSRAKLYLSNLSGANLRNANLKEAEFGGADLADADLTGADLTGASLVGAYIVGAKLDGEMVSTKPYVADDISEVVEDVYVEDTVKPKNNPATEDIIIGSRRDFEETSPAIIVENKKDIEIETEIVPETEEVEETVSSVPEVSVPAPMAKSSPAMQSVLVHEQEDVSADVVIVKEESVAVPVLTVQNDEIVEIDEEAGKSKIVEEPLIKEVPVEIAEKSKPDVTNASVEEQTAKPQMAGQAAEYIEPTAKGTISKEAVEQEFVNEESVTIVAPQVVALQTAIEETVPNALPENILINIERLLDTKSCYGCDLTGVNLSGVNLDSADLEGVNLSNAILAGTDLEDANLKGANLTNVDFTGADLSGADLYKADLSGANLSNAKLEKALLDDANMGNVKGYQPELLMMKP